jgi:hypothetical protein
MNIRIGDLELTEKYSRIIWRCWYSFLLKGSTRERRGWRTLAGQPALSLGDVVEPRTISSVGSSIRLISFPGF